MISCLACATLLAGRALAQDGVVLSLPSEDQRVVNALLGPGVVGQALPSTPIENASKYFPLQERALSYQVTGGSNAGTVQTLPVARGKRPNGNPAWRLALSPSLAGFIRQTPEGDLIMPAVSDAGGTSSSYHPANPFLLNGMKPVTRAPTPRPCR
jgi:hypothetical protein